MSDWKVGDRVDVFGDKGVLVGLATPLNGKERWLVRWDSDGFPTEVMTSNLRRANPDRSKADG